MRQRVRVNFFCLMLLLVCLAGPQTASADPGYLVAWHPEAIEETLSSGASTVQDLVLTFVNSSGSTFGWMVFVQDDPSCPGVGSMYDWIPLSPSLGPVPPGDDPVVIVVHIPLNAVGQSAGAYETHVCVTTDADLPTLLSIPVLLFVENPAGPVFADGFESTGLGAVGSE